MKNQEDNYEEIERQEKESRAQHRKDLKQLKQAELEVPDTNKERELRACRKCKMILSNSQWAKIDRSVVSKCPNGCSVNVTDDFQGYISMFMPSHSWVAKWNGLSGLKPGLYAMSVNKESDGMQIDHRERKTSNKQRKRERGENEWSDDDQMIDGDDGDEGY